MAENRMNNEYSDYRDETTAFSERQVAHDVLNDIQRNHPELYQEMRDSEDESRHTEDLPSWFQGDDTDRNIEILFNSFKENTSHLSEEENRTMATHYTEVLSRQIEHRTVSDVAGAIEGGKTDPEHATDCLRMLTHGQMNIADQLVSEDPEGFRKAMTSMANLPERINEQLEHRLNQEAEEETQHRRGRRRHGDQEAVDETGDLVQEATEATGDLVQGATEAAGNLAQEAVDVVGDLAQEAAEKAVEAADMASSLA